LRKFNVCFQQQQQQLLSLYITILTTTTANSNYRSRKKRTGGGWKDRESVDKESYHRNKPKKKRLSDQNCLEFSLSLFQCFLSSDPTEISRGAVYCKQCMQYMYIYILVTVALEEAEVSLMMGNGLNH
jgi:hypothetical protein